MRSAAELARLVQVLDGPLQDFIREARVRVALLTSGSGQVLAQHGFTRGYELGNVAALTAAAHASARALAELTGSGRWRHMHHAGRERQLFLAPLRLPGEELILVAIFDGDSSLGLVELYFGRLAETVAKLPELSIPAGGADAAGFERDLEAALERVLPPPPGEG